MAEKVLAKRKVQIAENRFLDVRRQSRTPFEELTKLYMDFAKANKASWERDEYSIKRLSSKFGGKRLVEITPLALEEYKTDRLKKVTPATVNRELGCLKHMFTKAMQWDLSTANPVKSIRMLKERNTRLRYLTQDEIVRVLGELDTRFKPVVIMALYTGMRRGEILKLKWTDLDLNHGIIFVRDSKNAEKREVPMALELVDVIRALPRKDERVFCEDDGHGIRSLRTAFERAVKKAGIEDFTFHDLRHTFASHMVMGGVDLLTVKELLGHKSITMTLRYAHLSPDHKRKAVESLRFLYGHNMDTTNERRKVV